MNEAAGHYSTIVDLNRLGSLDSEHRCWHIDLVKTLVDRIGRNARLYARCRKSSAGRDASIVSPSRRFRTLEG
jgi:hypothetical protein